jgi:lipoprotein-anchoring transpeptidase ErfK/SrfK
MYWYAKLILGLIVIAIVGILILIFHRHIPGLSSGSKAAQAGESAAAEIIEIPKAMVSIDDVVSHPAVTVDGEEAADAADADATSPEPPGADPELDRKLAIVIRHLAAEEYTNAGLLAEKIVRDLGESAVFSAAWKKAVRSLSAANTGILFSDIPNPEKVAYTVTSGDTLVGIAKKFNTTVSLIQKANALEETNALIFPRQTLHVYDAAWRIRVSKRHFLLLLMDGDRLVKTYNIGIGRQDRTPDGGFKVIIKQREPVWWRGGRAIRFGAPDNVLGTRWLGLEPVGETSSSLTGYGIHGTWEPETVGSAVSKGCIRMLNADVEELFNIVPVGTAVTIDN